MSGDKPEDIPKEGVKFDSDKLPWHLVPWDAVRAIVRVLQFGANKYAPRNWEKGMGWERLFRATIGHMTDWYMREGPDKETGFSHLWHAGCCILFLITFELRGIGTDDRPNIKTLKQIIDEEFERSTKAVEAKRQVPRMPQFQDDESDPPSA